MKPPLGSGQRFSALEGKLASRPGVRNPGALAEAIGRKEYGAKGMSALSHHGEGGAKTARMGMMNHLFGGAK